MLHWGASNEYPQPIFSWRNKKYIMRIPPFIWSNQIRLISSTFSGSVGCETYFSVHRIILFQLEGMPLNTVCNDYDVVNDNYDAEEKPQIEGWAQDYRKSDDCFTPNLISSPWRRYEDYNSSFCKQWKFRCHCSYEQWHLNLHCLQRGPSCP